MAQAVLVDDLVRETLSEMGADLRAALALHRATLHTLASLSQAMNSAAERALDEEWERASTVGSPDGRRVGQVVAELRRRLRPAAEERMARQMEFALMEAADALDDPIG